jgi:hypothetical protein
MTKIRDGAGQSKNKNEEFEKEENSIDQKSHRSKHSTTSRKAEFPPQVFHPRKRPSSQRNVHSDDEEKCLTTHLPARRLPLPNGAQFNIASASPSSPGFPAESTLPDKQTIENYFSRIISHIQNLEVNQKQEFKKFETSIEDLQNEILDI